MICYRFRCTWRWWLLAALGAAVFVAFSLWLQPVRTAEAQAQLTLADFDDDGLDVEFAALLQVGVVAASNSDVLYSVGEPWPGLGTLLDGDLNLGAADAAIDRISRTHVSTSAFSGNLNFFESDGNFNIGDYFDTDGADADLRLYLQDADTNLEDAAWSLVSGSSTFASLNLVAPAETLVADLVAGDRLIIAFARLSSLGQVSGVGATPDDHGAITVSWGAVANADGYVVEWDDDSAFGSPAEATISSGSTVTYQLTGLQEETAYYVRARATRTGVADGAWSTTASATTTLQSPAQVTMVATAASDLAITVTWANAVRADGYRIEWGTTSGSYTESATTTGLSYTISGLTPSTTHYLRVVSTRTGASDGTPSAESSATTDAALTPDQVTGVVITAISDRELQVTWNAAANATGYLVQWDTDSAFPDPEEATVPAAGAIIERLRAETEYFVRVKGTRAGAADGAWSAADSATTETARLTVWADRVPGGAVGAQLGLAVFGGVFAGFRFRTMKTPRREVLILLCMCGASLLLPLFGVGNLFWTGGIVLLAAASSAAVFFLASRA